MGSLRDQLWIASNCVKDNVGFEIFENHSFLKHVSICGWEVFQHQINTLGLLWDRFGITCGVLPVATKNVSGLESLKTKAFSACFRMCLGSFSASNEHSGITLGLLWDRFGITFGLHPTSTNNAAGLESLKTEAFSACFKMRLGSFSASNEHPAITLGLLWDRFGIAFGLHPTSTHNAAGLEFQKTEAFG